MPSPQGNNLDKLRNRIGKGRNPTVDTIIYQLSKELHCLGDIIGREYEVSYDKLGRVKTIRQKPMKIVKLMSLIREAKHDMERQEKAMKKNKTPRGRK